jgi:type IV secretory pathway VirJ component
MRTAAGIALIALSLTGCAARLHSKPGVFETSYDTLRVKQATFDITLVKPVSPHSSKVLVVFATGDAGWMGASAAVFAHIAERGYYAAGFDSRELVKHNRESGEMSTIEDSAKAFDEAFTHVKEALGLSKDTPVIVTGMSRGASMVIFTAAHKDVRKGISGAIAIALTKESDYLRAPDPAVRPPGLKVDEKERILFYPILPLLSSMPVAVIQSTHDRYCPAAESRRLMGPDTPMLRLYPVDALNHGFGGGTKQLLADLDDALKWIESKQVH